MHLFIFKDLKLIIFCSLKISLEKKKNIVNIIKSPLIIIKKSITE